MGNCKYCGNPAGIFRRKHAACENTYRAGKNIIFQEIINTIKDGSSCVALEEKLSKIEQSSYIPHKEVRLLCLAGWEHAIDNFLEDGILDNSEEDRLLKFSKHFSLSNSELDAHGALTKTVKAAILRDILNGIIPDRVSNASSLPVNLQKNEQVVWAFPNSNLLEDKTRRQYVGGSSGVSVRVMKGVYYRVGAFKGHSVEYTERVHTGTGWFIVTNKNIYFISPSKSLRIPYTKIISFDPYSDGLGIMRDSASAKAQVFVTGDGWFTYNLVCNLAQM